MTYLRLQFKRIVLITVSILFIWPFGSWGAVIYNDSQVKINESVEVKANTGGNYLNVNGTLTELETAPAEVKVKINNVINGRPVSELNIIQEQVGEVEKKVEYVSPDNKDEVTSEVKINVAGSNEQAAESKTQNTNNRTQEDKQQTTDDNFEVNSPEQAISDVPADNLLTKLSNFFSHIFQGFWNIFS